MPLYQSGRDCCRRVCLAKGRMKTSFIRSLTNPKENTTEEPYVFSAI